MAYEQATDEFMRATQLIDTNTDTKTKIRIQYFLEKPIHALWF